MDDFFSAINHALSAVRLASYRIGSETDADALARYLWNVALCEAVYPALQNLEVAFRNTIHSAVTNRYGNEFWFYEDKPLLERERDEVFAVEADLKSQGKRPEAGQIVAELSFGFWTQLLARAYGYQPRTHQALLWPDLLKAAFPNMPPGLRTRENLAGRFNKIRTFRNRVFHHEPIWRWPNLAQQYLDIIEAIDWISPQLKRLTNATSRFPNVYHRGTGFYLQRIQGLAQPPQEPVP